MDLVTDRIETITPTGVRTAGGVEHEVDTLVLATGFKVFDRGNMPPYPVLGRDGVNLERWWDENRFQAYQGVSVPGFPNLFTILGPYAYNGASYFTLIENQSKHIVRCLRRARKRGATSVEVRPEANRRYLRVDAAPAQEPGLLPRHLRHSKQLLLRPPRRRALPRLPHGRGGLAQRTL